MNAGTKPNALEGIGVLAESESLLELGLTFLKDTETWKWTFRHVELQVYLVFLIFAFDFVTKLERNEVSAKHDFLRITGVTKVLIHGSVFLSFDVTSHYVHYA